ncbi:MAG: cellulase family glycosylhydrolase [Terracidiphilus sp.]|jgi:aryl-phospho-beta-D-glucosidase BglC (GH1 family)
MKQFTIAILTIALLCGLSALAQAANPAPEKKQVNDWWHQAYPLQPLNSPDGKKLALISVSGNRFVDPSGKPVLLRGVNIADPDKTESQGHWSKELFVKVKETGATVVRIPVHPVAWRARGAKNYLALLDQAVQWSTDLGLYVDIDWHSIGNLKQGLFQDPMYETSLPETLNFWRTMAAHFNGNHTVAFFELFNEPTDYRGQLGSMSWSQWREINEEIISLIRAYDNETVPLVAGLDWAYDLAPLRDDPVRAERIGYVTHPYPNKRSRPWPLKWEEDFGFAADRYPVIATELGFDSSNGTKEEGIEYGNEITKYLESRNISWVVWCFDPEWGPSMISSWDTFALTEEGKFFSDAMRAKGAAASPAAGK